ncbi:MAG: hypothetical protein QM770_08760 [Tepidisphaeraceae bacterium]
MKWLRLLTCVSFLSIGSLSAVAPADYPKPAAVPTSWDLDWKHDEIKRIVLTLPGETAPRAYWYLTFVATNNTGEDRPFFPIIEMVTKEGKVLRSNREMSASVFEAIAKREAKSPLIPLEKATGTILQGEDRAKYSVAIWEEPSSEMGSFNIFVAGLSGETAPLTDSEGKPVTNADGLPILLRKAKEIDFTVRGDALYANDPVVQTGESWVMR